MPNRRKFATPGIRYTDDPLPEASVGNEHGIGDKTGNECTRHISDRC